MIFGPLLYVFVHLERYKNRRDISDKCGKYDDIRKI